MTTLRALVILVLVLAAARLVAAQRAAPPVAVAVPPSPATIAEMVVHEAADAPAPGHRPTSASPARVTVELHIVDARSQQPVPGARVALRDGAGRDWAFGNGWLRVSVPPASGLRWRVSAPGYLPSEWTPLPDLDAGQVFSGIVPLQPSP